MRILGAIIFWATVLAISSLQTAWARDIIQLNFAASGFSQGPTDAISGSFVYEAASVTSPITSLDSVSLTIDGHVYGIGDIGFLSPFGGGPMTLIGGVPAGVSALQLGAGQTNDFILDWVTNSGSPFDFSYTTPTVYADFPSQLNLSFTVLSVIPETPEPASIVLALSGVAVLFARARRLQR